MDSRQFLEKKYVTRRTMSVKREIDPSHVRTLCAGIAAKEQIHVKRKTSMKIMKTQQKKESSVTTLEDILLNDLSVKERNKLMKRIPPILKELRTTDIDTARSFLRLERYADVRNKIVAQLNEFANVDLKMDIVDSKSDA